MSLAWSYSDRIVRPGTRCRIDISTVDSAAKVSQVVMELCAAGKCW